MPQLPPIGAFSGYLDSALSIVSVAVVFGLIIFVHEFGHFIFAKLVGVKVEKFSLGFGKKLIGFTWGETEYVLSMLPLGGYVKMLGEMPGEEIDEPERAFTSKKIWQRALVIGAGPTVNYLFAFPLAISCFLIGINVPTATISEPNPDMPAFAAGLRKNDTIVEVDGHPIENYRDLMVRVNFADDPAKPRRVVVERTENGETRRITKLIKTRVDPDTGQHQIGVPYFVTTIVGSVDKAGREAGLKRGDEIISVDGRPVRNWSDISSAISDKKDKPVELVVRRSDKTYKTTFRQSMKTTELIGIEIVPRPVIAFVQGEDSPAGKAGLIPDDLIESVDGRKLAAWTDVVDLMAKSRGKTVELVIRRKGETVNVLVPVPEKSPWRASIGIAGSFGSTPNGIVRPSSIIVGKFSEGSKAAEGGLRIGDWIIEANGEKVPNVSELRKVLAKQKGRAELKVRRGEDETADLSIELIPVTHVDDKSPGFYGLPAHIREKYPLGVAVKEGINRTLYFTKWTVVQLVRLVSGEASGKAMSGPVGIAKVAFGHASESTAELLHLFVVISIGLAFLNLMPIPILDGGHLLFLAIELVVRRRLNDRILEIAQYVGLFLLLSLMLYVTKNDIFRFFM